MDVIEHTSDGKTRLRLEYVDWYAVLPQLGIDLDYLSHPRKLGPCPVCGGNTRFRFLNDDGRGHWFCNGCGVGDAPKLVSLFYGCSSFDAMLKIKDTVLKASANGQAPKRVAPIQKEPDREFARKVLRETVAASERMTRDSAAWRYLSGRIPGLKFEWLSPSLRVHRNLYHQQVEEKDPETKKVLRKKKVTFWPAMLGIVVDRAGVPVTIHRTYLTAEGAKAPFDVPEEVKKQMTGVRKLRGDHIPVNVPSSTSPKKLRILIICEGIETALAIVAMTGNEFPVWAMLNAANLSVVDFAEDAYDMIVVGVDHDFPDQRGRRAGIDYARRAEKLCQERGKRVVLRVPEHEGEDWCDAWSRMSHDATADTGAFTAA